MGLDANMMISRFQLPAGTAEASLAGNSIVGRFGETPLVIKNAARTSEEFANLADTPTAVLRFTRKYAPLMQLAKPGDTFQFELSEWQVYRRIFCNTWKNVATEVPPQERAEKYWLFPKGSRLILSRMGNALQQEQFFGLLNLCFSGLPLERVRFCPALQCKKPFFIATHLKQSLCGNQACIAWASKKRKLAYWNRNKAEFLAERKRTRTGADHVSRKTR
jgi:hypothetical protein